MKEEVATKYATAERSGGLVLHRAWPIVLQPGAQELRQDRRVAALLERAAGWLRATVLQVAGQCGAYPPSRAGAFLACGRHGTYLESIPGWRQTHLRVARRDHPARALDGPIRRIL